MTATQRTIARACRRLMLRDGLRVLGWSMLIAAGLSAAALVMLHAFGRSASGWAWAVPTGLAVVVSVIIVMLRRRSSASVAVMIDVRLELKDSLGTSLALNQLDGGPFAAQVRDDAERAAASASLSKAFPVRPTRVWGGAAAACGVAAVLALDPFGLIDAAQLRKAEALAAQQKAQQIEQALAKAAEIAETLLPNAEKHDDPQGQLPGAGAADLDEQLEALLTQRDLTNPEDHQAATAEVSDLQERFEQAIEEKQSEAQAIQNAMSTLDTGEPNERGPADRFTDALRRADFQAAQQELATLADELKQGDLSASQQKRLAEQLETLSEQLDTAARMQREAAARAQREAQAAAEDAGLPPEKSEQIAEKKDSSGLETQNALREALEEQGVPSDQAQAQAERLAEQIEQANKQAQSNEAAGETAERLAEQMQEMAEAVREASPESSPQNENDEPNPDGSSPQSADSGEPQPGDAGQPSSSQDQQQQQLSEAMQQAQQELGQAAQDQQQLENMQQANQQMQEAMQQMAESPPPPETSPEGSESQPGQPSQSDEQQAQSQQPGSQPGEGQQPGQGQQQTAEQSDQPGDGDQPGSSSDQKGNGNQPGDPGSSGQQQAAGDGQGPGDGQGSGGNPLGESRDPLPTGSRVERDLQDGDGGRVLSSWQRDGQPGEGSSNLTFNQAVDEARSEAERAVSEQRVPKRYQKSIREYFGNLPDAPPPPEVSPPVTPASPADVSGGGED